MANQCYDCFFLLDSNKYNRDPGGVAAGLQSLIEEHQGEILVSRLWEERKLAYPVNGQNKGTYWISYFRMPGDKLTPFNRACQLNDQIMRVLVTKVDERLVDALVSHTQGSNAASDEDAESKEETATAT